MVVVVEVAAVGGGVVGGRSVTRGEVHPQGVKFRKRMRAGRGGARRERGRDASRDSITEEKCGEMI